MVDSGLTAEIITPELRQHLGIKSSGGKVAGLAAGGASAAGDLVSGDWRRPLYSCLSCVLSTPDPAPWCAPGVL